MKYLSLQIPARYIILLIAFILTINADLSAFTNDYNTSNSNWASSYTPFDYNEQEKLLPSEITYRNMYKQSGGIIPMADDLPEDIELGGVEREVMVSTKIGFFILAGLLYGLGKALITRLQRKKKQERE